MSALLTLSGDPLALILAGAAFAVFVAVVIVAGRMTRAAVAHLDVREDTGEYDE